MSGKFSGNFSGKGKVLPFKQPLSQADGHADELPSDMVPSADPTESHTDIDIDDVVHDLRQLFTDRELEAMRKDLEDDEN